jgi:hypothetical protein
VTLRSVAPEATPEEVIAIVAAIAEVTRPVVAPMPVDDTPHKWVHARA